MSFKECATLTPGACGGSGGLAGGDGGDGRAGGGCGGAGGGKLRSSYTIVGFEDTIIDELEISSVIWGAEVSCELMASATAAWASGAVGNSTCHTCTRRGEEGRATRDNGAGDCNARVQSNSIITRVLMVIPEPPHCRWTTMSDTSTEK
eukprot:6429787-Prymnesium_polylepis.1